MKPERRAQLEVYARRHGQDATAALDDVLARFLAWEQREHEEAVAGIREGYADMKAGRMRPIEESFAALRAKHGLPR